MSRLFDVKCSRRSCAIELRPHKAWRRYEGSAYRTGDPYCEACAGAINRHARRTLVLAPWYPGLIVRRIADGAHAEVLSFDEGPTAVVRFGVAGSRAVGIRADRVVTEVARVAFTIVPGTDVLRGALP